VRRALGTGRRDGVNCRRDQLLDGSAMRFLPFLLLLLLPACTEATASKVDERTFRIEGPAMSMLSDAPNRRLATRICPKGYRVLDSETHRGGPDRAAYEAGDLDSTTTWTIRCI
jgi:hypothetical protein